MYILWSLKAKLQRMKSTLFMSILCIVVTHLMAQKSTVLLTNNFDHQFDSIALHSEDKKIDHGKTDVVINNLLDLLLEMEKPTEFYKEISPDTRRLISSKNDPYILVLLDRAIHNRDTLSGHLHLKTKFLKEVSNQTNLIMKEKYPYYNYATQQKELIKFVSIRSGNDLFTLAGLYSLALPDDKHIRDGNTFFQRNDDRDYTGSFLLEIGTDYLKAMRRRPVKTYQTILYGFDVYTPYFRDTLKFPNDTSYNRKDRPHASFQYFGWSKKGLSRRNKYRWATTIKFGKIGGNIGAKFQNALHQDISYSPRPRGWSAQISNGGRIGFSVEYEREFWPIDITMPKQHESNSWKKLHGSVFIEEKLGTYMTTSGLGVRLTNKSLARNNQNFINHRIRQHVYDFVDNLMYSISFKATYVIHNSMLEGYGIFKTHETDNDPLTPHSIYYLNMEPGQKQVRRMNYVLNTSISYTTRFGTLFYNWKSISSETNLGLIGIPSPASNKEMDISNRWHHFAEIGFTFNTH